MITLHSVSKEVGRGRLRRLVLDDVTWTIPSRAQYVILGHKGAGKTTLLNIISGTTIPNKGWVERRASISPGRSLLRAFGTDTPRQITLQLERLYRVPAEEIATFIARFADMERAMNVSVKSLPNAMRQRLGYALTYAIPFDFYLFDGSIGPQRGDFARACREAFDARSKQAGVILTTSQPRIAKRFDGAGGVLHNGKIELFATVHEAVAAFNKLPHSESEPSLVESIDDEDDDEDDWL
jgi:capsular polysaccharide transport system ATP-binding protein